MEIKYLLLALILRVSVFASQNVATDDGSIELISISIEQSSENELILGKKKEWRKSPFLGKTMELKRHLEEDETCQDSTSFQFISYGETLRTCKWVETRKQERAKEKAEEILSKSHRRSANFRSMQAKLWLVLYMLIPLLPREIYYIRCLRT